MNALLINGWVQGVIDPIVELSSLCAARDVGLHVDCCLGGFILPFMVSKPISQLASKKRLRTTTTNLK